MREPSEREAALTMTLIVGIGQLRQWMTAWAAMASSSKGELSDMAKKTAILFADTAEAAEAHIAELRSGLATTGAQIDVDVQVNAGFRRRLFVLNRLRDIGGISGTGYVAEGMESSDGRVVLFWRIPPLSVSLFGSAVEMMQVHGHDGDTRLEWLDR